MANGNSENLKLRQIVFRKNLNYAKQYFQKKEN